MTCASNLAFRQLLLCCAIALAGVPSVANASSVRLANTSGRQHDFSPCADRTTDPVLFDSRCAHFTVPLDRRQSDGDKISLFIRKFPARTKSRGQIWLVAGGPGESGASFYPLLAVLRGAFPGFDLIIPDHRGTGFSDRLCPEEERPSSAGGSALEGLEWQSCFAAINAVAQRARAFSIGNAANDLRLMIDHYGTSSQTWVYGVSYGTQLVIRMLHRPPKIEIKGVILDSLVPPEQAEAWDLSHRSFVVDAVGRRVLQDCDRLEKCSGRFGGSTENALRSIVDDPSSTKLIGGDPKQFFAGLLDIPRLRAAIPDLIAGLGRGDVTALADIRQQQSALAARFSHFPQSAISIPLTAIISASENNGRPGLTAAQLATESQSLLFTSNLPGLLVDPGLPTYSKDIDFGRLPETLPPILVLHGDIDPKTPYEGARAHVALLQTVGRVSFQPVNGAPHYLLLTAPRCFKNAVRSFMTTKSYKKRPCAIAYDLDSRRGEARSPRAHGALPRFTQRFRANDASNSR
jgi:pimeloyl-ACP methyl ester carboxylesterase